MLGTQSKFECRSSGVWVTMTLLLRMSEAGGDSGMLWSPQEVLWVYDLTKYHDVTRGDAHTRHITFT